MSLIKKLQKKPRHVRIAIVWVGAALCMLIIMSLWAMNLKSDLKRAAEESKQITKEESGALASLKETGKSLSETVPTLFGAIKDLYRSVVESFSDKSSDLQETASKIEEENSQLNR